MKNKFDINSFVTSEKNWDSIKLTNMQAKKFGFKNREVCQLKLPLNIELTQDVQKLGLEIVDAYTTANKAILSLKEIFGVESASIKYLYCNEVLDVNKLGIGKLVETLIIHHFEDNSNDRPKEDTGLVIFADFNEVKKILPDIEEPKSIKELKELIAKENNLKINSVSTVKDSPFTEVELKSKKDVIKFNIFLN
jgi:hypothetical protein